MRVVVTALVISFATGLVLMVADAACGFRWKWAPTVVATLYLPPLAVVGIGILAVVINGIWALL